MTKDSAASVKSICIAGAAAATGAVETTWLIAVIAIAYILCQSAVDTWGG